MKSILQDWVLCHWPHTHRECQALSDFWAGEETVSETQEKGQTGFPSPSREGDPSQEPGLHGNEGDSAERLVSAGS